MYRALLLLPLAAALAACTTTYDMPRDPDGYRNRLNTEAARHAATVTFDDGRQVRVLRLNVGPEQTSWVGADSSAQVSSERLREVQFVKNGARQGLRIGALVGSAVGALFGLASPGSSSSCPMFCVTRGGNVALGATFGAPVGAVAGLVIGSINGKRVVYRF